MRKSQATEVEAILAQRGQSYGPFPRHAEITQKLKQVMREHGYLNLAPDQVECLDMLAHKVGRILNGNPDIVDHWDDIAGYSRLVSKRLQGEPL